MHVLTRAFEPLLTTKAPDFGTGRGLAQVLAMTEQAKGTARIRSSAGMGTTGELLLPRSHRGLPPLLMPQASTNEQSPEVPRKLLLVDDNEELAAALAAVLDTTGRRTTLHQARSR